MSGKKNTEHANEAGVYTVTPLNVCDKGGNSLKDRWMAAINKRYPVAAVPGGLNLHLTQHQLDALDNAGRGSKQDKRWSLPCGNAEHMTVNIPLTAVCAMTTQTSSVSTNSHLEGVTVSSSSTASVPASVPIISVSENTMGPLRSGKVYSPSRNVRGGVVNDNIATRVVSKKRKPISYFQQC